MSGFWNDAQLAGGNVLAHQLRFVHSGEDVFVSGDQQRGNIDGLQGFDGVGAGGHAALHLGDVLRIMRNAPSTRSGRISRVVLPNSFGIIDSKNGSVPRSRTSLAACRRPARASGPSAGALVLHNPSAATRPRCFLQNSNST